MTRLSDPLKALMLAEQRAVGPTAENAAACWDRIAADLQRGALPTLDVTPPPAPPRHALTWIALSLIGAAALAAGLYAWRSDGEAAAPTAPQAPNVIVPPSLARADEWAEPAVSTPPPEERAGPAAETAPIRQESPAAPAPEESEVAADPAPAAVKSRRPVAGDPVPEDTFAAELKLLAEGHAALNRGDAAGALRVADLYKRTYPRGHFKEDREALHALAQCAAGRGSAAARRFALKHPRSIHVTRIREACGLLAEVDE